MIHKIVYWPDPILHRQSDLVVEFDDRLRMTIKSMFDTLRADSRGVGLSAIQIGIPQAITVIDMREKDRSPLVLINAKIVREEGAEVQYEGCLSMPGISEKIVRPKKITVLAHDENGFGQEIDAEGLLARAICHEVDHQNGILYIDHMSQLKRSLMISKFKKTRQYELRASNRMARQLAAAR